MELKLINELNNLQRAKSSNRTFMELKFRFCDNYIRSHTVLIVPLWN